jgi:hypothetical protein
LRLPGNSALQILGLIRRFPAIHVTRMINSFAERETKRAFKRSALLLTGEF